MKINKANLVFWAVVVFGLVGTVFGFGFLFLCLSQVVSLMMKGIAL